MNMPLYLTGVFVALICIFLFWCYMNKEEDKIDLMNSDITLGFPLSIGSWFTVLALIISFIVIRLFNEERIFEIKNPFHKE